MPKNSKKTIEEVKQFIKEKYNGKIEILSTEYKNNKSPLTVKCNDCGIIREICYNKLSIDSCCPTCSRKKQKTPEEFRKEVFKMYGNEYCVIGNYINRSTKINFKHNKCNNIFFMSPTNFLSGHKCPNCSHGSIRYTKEEYLKKFKSKENFEIIDLYVGYKNKKESRTKMTLKCKKCNNLFERSMLYCTKNFIYCPFCESDTSAPVRAIKNYLEKENYSFMLEKVYDNLKSSLDQKTSLRFDFFLEKNNILIEFDGKQHFNAKMFNNDRKLLHSYDIQKNAFINKQKNILLFRIKYDNFLDIEMKNISELEMRDIIKKFIEPIIFKKRSTTKSKVIFISKLKEVSRKEYYLNYKAK